MSRDTSNCGGGERGGVVGVGKKKKREMPQVTGMFGLGVQNEVGQRLIEFCQENSLVIANTLIQQYKRQLSTWTPPNGQY